MLILNENEICPHANDCPYNGHHTCFGARSNRDHKFECAYVKDGVIMTGGVDRLSEDKTGKMKVIMEQ